MTDLEKLLNGLAKRNLNYEIRYSTMENGTGYQCVLHREGKRWKEHEFVNGKHIQTMYVCIGRNYGAGL